MTKSTKRIVNKKSINKKNQKKKNNYVDRAIEIVLIIVIILLLLHNCGFSKKEGKEKTPSGNVNIIEIKCDDNGKCRKDDKNGEIVVDDNTKSSGSKKSENKGSVSPSDSNDSGESEDDSEEEDDGNFKVYDKKVTWSESTDLNIFSNSFYNYEDIIAPESSNVYQFVLKNSTDYNLKYSISFSETNPYNINLKYKLKKNNSYIVSNYVSYDQLNLSDELLNSKKSDTFYLEWKWISSDNDTDVGKIQANYNLKINVEAESVNE
ncbi:MAG: hypothetical protein IKG27_00505 [Bacilli bacterium]|nr:hypothetical protein [Bacilli bacterium]